MEKSSQNSWGGKGPLDIIWSNCSAQAVPPLAGDPEPCGDGFWDGDSMGRPYQCSVTFTAKKNISWCSGGTYNVSVCACCFLLLFNTLIQKIWALQENDERKRKYRVDWKRIEKIFGYHLSTAQMSGTRMTNPQGLLMK